VSRLRFDPRRPIFATGQSFQAFGKVWAADSPFPWEDMGMDYQEPVIHQLYESGFLAHRPDLEDFFMEESRKAVGDGLESFNLDELHNLVKRINKDIMGKCKNPNDYRLKRCPSSKIKDKQIGLIRRWRNTYGHLE
jgi:hypothetical protein